VSIEAVAVASGDVAGEGRGDGDHGGAGEGAAAGRGAVEGRLLDQGKGTPVAGARIFVRGQPVEGRSDRNGRFTLRLPAGGHDLTVVHTRFATATVRAVAVVADAETPLEIALARAAVELDAFTVSAPRIVGSTLESLAERRSADAVSDVIGAEQMARSGDSNAAGALKRATGVTVVGGRFVYVRGLGERYSSTLLNRCSLPSPEPERRVVPLDMFPAEQLEGVVIQKGYTPDLPAEFGGGTVRLRTRAYPKKLQGRLSLSTGLTLGQTFTRGLMSASGPTDVLGVDGGFRGLPDEVAAASRAAPLLERDMFSTRGYTAAELERFGEALVGRMTPRRALVPPDLGLGAMVGDSGALLGGHGGFLLSASYGSDWRREEATATLLTVGAGGALEPAHHYQFDETEHRVTLAGLLSMGLDWGEAHKLRATTLLNRITTDGARVYEGSNRDVATDIRVSRLRWIERMLLSQQLRGLHRFDKLRHLTIDWRYAISVATRLEPDRVQTRYDYEPAADAWYLSDRPEGNRRVFSDLDDLAHDLGVDAELDVWRGGGATVRLKAGAWLLVKDREVDTRRYKYVHKGPLSTDAATLALTPQAIFTPERIGSDGFQLTETTLETDNYLASQLAVAGYVSGELSLGEALTVAAGARVEHSSQQVQTFEPFNPDGVPITADLTKTDVLPALTATWAFNDAMALRLGASRTVSRPDFRELSPATFNDVTGGRQLFGNPDLNRAILSHADLRWDWFPSAGELVSLGAFYKHFQDPIEVIVVPSAQLSVTYANAAAANNVGLELEARKTLGAVHPALADLYVAANASWIYSRVALPRGRSIQTSKVRPLQGQSPFVVNVQLGYDNADTGTSASLLYNVAGRRIVEVGALGAPDVYSEPFHQLDLVLSQKLGAGLALSLKLKNLIDLPVAITQGSHVTRTWHRGRQLSVGIGKAF
jgi:outer membrane receptor protein involved in Fe transport